MFDGLNPLYPPALVHRSPQWVCVAATTGQEPRLLLDGGSATFLEGVAYARPMISTAVRVLA